MRIRVLHAVCVHEDEHQEVEHRTCDHKEIHVQVQSEFVIDHLRIADREHEQYEIQRKDDRCRVDDRRALLLMALSVQFTQFCCRAPLLLRIMDEDVPPHPIPVRVVLQSAVGEEHHYQKDEPDQHHRYR